MSHQPIPLSKPDITQREIDAVADVMRSDTLSIGPKLEEFEAHCARIAGRSHAVGVSSGTTAGRVPFPFRAAVSSLRIWIRLGAMAALARASTSGTLR